MIQNKRPNNYLDEFETLREKHLEYYQAIEESKLRDSQLQMQWYERQNTAAKTVRLNKVLKTVDQIQKSEIVKDNLQDELCRTFLCKAVYPVISQGLLKVVEIKPVDPVDYLVGYPSSRPSICLNDHLSFNRDSRIN